MIWYDGIIFSIAWTDWLSHCLAQVLYEDGDEEELSDEEYRACKVTDTAVPSATMKELIKRLNTAPSPFPNHRSTISPGAARGRKRRRISAGSAASKGRRKSSEEGERGAVSGTAPHRTKRTKGRRASRGAKLDGPLAKKQTGAGGWGGGEPRHMLIEGYEETSIAATPHDGGGVAQEEGGRSVERDIMKQQFVCRNFEGFGKFFGVVYASSADGRTCQVVHVYCVDSGADKSVDVIPCRLCMRMELTMSWTGTS